jgi:ABC-type dipeptide/oligopeptide/nickel transport system permease component
MRKFVANAKLVLWEFVELAFLTLLALVLLSMLLGKNAGPYVQSVADNVAKFSSTASSGMLGIVIVLAIIYLALRRMKPERGSRSRSS